MNIGPNQPAGGHSGQGGRRRRRRGRGGAPNRGGQPGSQQNGGGGGRSRNQAFTGPMDHSYRNGTPGNQQNGGGSGRRPGRGRPQPAPKFFQHPEIEPLPVRENAETKIYCFIDDLFFLAKIQEVSRKLNIKVEFVKSGDELIEKMGANGDGNGASKPSLIIFDLNNANAKPLTTIPKLKKMLKKETAIIGFLSHLQADLKSKAQEAGCDMVLPRSAFSSNLPQLLRRHAADDEPEEMVQ